MVPPESKVRETSANEQEVTMRFGAVKNVNPFSNTIMVMDITFAVGNGAAVGFYTDVYVSVGGVYLSPFSIDVISGVS